MLMPAIERDREHGARFPLEGDARALVVPDRGRAAAVEHEDHLLEELALGRERFAGWNLADVAIVRGARGVVIDIDAAAAAARPVAELGCAEVRHVVAADDLEPLGADPALIGRVAVLLGGEFLGEVFGNLDVWHELLPANGDACGRIPKAWRRLFPQAG